MNTSKMAMAFAVATSVAALSTQAGAATQTVDVVESGSATIEFTAPFLDYSLWTNWSTNDAGNPSRDLSMRSSNVAEDGTVSRSYVLEDGVDATLGGSLYIFPLDVAGDTSSELESFDAVKNFDYGESDPSVTDEMKDINYVPTGTAGEYTNYETGELLTLTPEQEALLEDGEVRTCCRNALTGLSINTADGYIDGTINGVSDRDIDFDGDVDEDDYFHLFTFGDELGEGLFELVLTDTLASFLNYAFSAYNTDYFPLFDEWAYAEDEDGILTFAGGDILGTVSYDYTLGTETFVAPVPIPAALPLLAGGLGLMGLIGSRRARKAA